MSTLFHWVLKITDIAVYFGATQILIYSEKLILNGEVYLNMLEIEIDPLIKEKLGNDPLLFEQKFHFKRDGGPVEWPA